MRNRSKNTESESSGTFANYFVPPIAALVLLGILTLLSLENIQRSESTIARAHQANAITKDLQLHILNAETGQRGYLLSGERSYLQPYHSAQALVQNELIKLKNISEVLNVDIDYTTFDELAQQRFEQLRHTIQLQEQGKHEEVAAFVASHVGENTMNKIRSAAAKIESRLATKINESDRRASDVHLTAWVTAAITIPLALFAVIWSLLRADAELQRRKRGEEIIRRRALQLKSMADIIARIVAAKDVDSVIGIVVRTTDTYAFVDLFTSPGFESTAFIFGPNVFSPIEGMGGGVARVRLPQGVAIESGQLVILPGVSSGVYGEIVRVENEPTQPEQYGYITPPLAMSNLLYVSVGLAPVEKKSDVEIDATVRALLRESARLSSTTTMYTYTTTTEAVLDEESESGTSSEELLLQ